MCEILMIILGCIQIGKMLRAKGHDPVMYQVMFAAGWIVGEIGGIVLGALIAAGNRDAAPIIVLFALMGAACGAGGAFFMASSVKARKTTNYGSGGGNKYGGGYGGGGNQQVMFPPNLQDPYASPQYPQQQYPPPQQYTPGPYQQPPTFPQQPYPQQPYPQQPYPQQPFAPPPPAPFPQQQVGAPIRFACPQGHVLEDDSSAAGQQRSCPICSTNFIVPGPAIPTAKPVATPSGVRRTPPPKKA